MLKDRSLQLLARYGPPLALILVCILGTFFAVTFLQRKLMNSGPQLFPRDQLERSNVSRKQVLADIKRVLEFSKARQLNRQSGKGLPLPEENDKKFVINSEKILDIIHAMGYEDIVQKFGWQSNEEQIINDVPNSLSLSGFLEKDAATDNAVCANLTFSIKDTKHITDSTLCPRLLKLREAINSGKEPPLLTLFSWWPDPITDAEKNRRKIMFRNWKFLEPFVQPILFTDSRINMAQCNSEDLPCLPIPAYNQDGVPLFRNLSAVTQANFQSTFYGYVRATSIFDVSLLQTLIAVKEIYDPSDNKTPKPILVYGRASHKLNILYMLDKHHISVLTQDVGNFTWEDTKNSMVYFIYKDQNFKDFPSFIIDDKFLTTSVVSRSKAKGHVVIDASNTIPSIYNDRNKTTSEWGREYIHTKPRDPYYNKKLLDQYMSDLSKAVPEKWSDELHTHFDKNGRVIINSSKN